jgi:MFS family permease
VAKSAAWLGAVIGAFSLGGVLGAVVYGARGHRWSRRLTFLVGGVAFSVGILSMGLMVSAPVLVGIMFLMGLIVGPNGPLISTITHERTPAAMRGRVLSIVNAMCFAGGPLGFAVAGWMVPNAGWQATVLGAGALFAATVTVLVFDKGLRELNSSRE